VPRRAAAPKSKLDRLLVLPWGAIVQAGVEIAQRWRALSAKDRARLTRLVRDSGGSVGNLSSKQRAELRGLVSKLDLKGLGRELLPLARSGRDRGRGRHKRRCARA
jgi:hypothetical protein